MAEFEINESFESFKESSGGSDVHLELYAARIEYSAIPIPARISLFGELVLSDLNLTSVTSTYPQRC